MAGFLRFTRAIVFAGALVASGFSAEPNGVGSARYALEAFTEPNRVLELAAAEPGRVAEIHVRRGSHVKTGDLLVELDTSVLQASRRVAEQRTQSTARRDALLVELRRKSRRYATLKGLSRDGVGTPDELLDAEAEEKITQLKVREAEEELERARLALQELDAQIEQRRIRARVDGVITDIHREVGEFVSAVEPQLATLVDLSRLRLSFFLDTQLALPLQEGQSVKMQAVGTDAKLAGTIEYVGPLTQADSGRVRVDVLVDNPTRQYRSGLRCRLLIDESSKVAGK